MSDLKEYLEEKVKWFEREWGITESTNPDTLPNTMAHHMQWGRYLMVREVLEFISHDP